MHALLDTGVADTPATTGSVDVATLVRRAAEGDEAAWNEIVDRYAGLLWSVVRGFRLGDAQAADAVQTTWLRLLEHLPAVREPERLGGWLRTTARRVCLEVLREARREEPADLSEEHARFGCPATADADGPEGCALRRDREAAVRRAVLTLPERQQRLLALLVADPQPSYEEIGTRLGMPVGSIGPTRARILARLRGALEAADVAMT